MEMLSDAVVNSRLEHRMEMLMHQRDIIIHRIRTIMEQI
jgi:hypothetical protein